MPSRVIREGWIESERITELDAAGERFFLRLCLRADDFGRYHANPVLLRSNLFPLHEDIRSTDIPRWLAACEKAGLVRCFVADGKRFLEIPKFNQRMRAAVSRFPAPASDTPTNGSHMPDMCPSSVSDPPPESEAEAEGEREADPVPSAVPTKADVAEPIYLAYPRRQGRQAAFKAIHSAMRVNPYERLLERTQAYAAAVALWPAPDRERYVPHPATWFNRGSFDDDPATWQRNVSPPTNGRAGWLPI